MSLSTSQTPRGLQNTAQVSRESSQPSVARTFGAVAADMGCFSWRRWLKQQLTGQPPGTYPRILENRMIDWQRGCISKFYSGGLQLD